MITIKTETSNASCGILSWYRVMVNGKGFSLCDHKSQAKAIVSLLKTLPAMQTAREYAEYLFSHNDKHQELRRIKGYC